MKNLLKKSLSCLMVLAMILSTITVFAETKGVTGISAKRSSNVLTLSWTNPAEGELNYNEITQTHNGETKTIAKLENGETSVTADVTDGGAYYFVITSSFADGTSAQSNFGYLRPYADSSAFNGWLVDVRDETPNNTAFRGEYKLAYDEKHSGNSSAYFRVDHNRESNVYLKLFKSGIKLLAGQEYCLSFWFKTNNYGVAKPDGGNYRSQIKYIDPLDKNHQVGIEIDENYPNGEWHNFKTYFSNYKGDYTTGEYSISEISMILDCYGEIWIDDIEVYAVDDNKDRISQGDALENIGTFEEERGVTGLTAKRSSSNATLSWTNPTNEDFNRNEIYVQVPGEERVLLNSSFNDTSYTHTDGVKDPNSYKYTVVSYYDSGITVENEVMLFRSGDNTSTFPGWHMDTYDSRNVADFRGGSDISADEAYDGDCSAHIFVKHTRETAVYKTLWKDISCEAGVEYCYSFMFKTQNHEGNNGCLFYMTPPTTTKTKLLAGTDYKDGEWTKKEVKFTPTKTGNVKLYFEVDAYGDVYIDDVKLYKVSEGETGNLLIKNGVNYGSFEEINGVKDFAYTTPDTATITLNWKNPAISLFEKNELYLVEDGERKLVASFADGETAYDFTNTEPGKAYEFVMVSYFGDKTKESALTAYAKRIATTTELVPGWKLEYRDTNPERYRGKVGVDTSIAHSGNSSLFFMMENPMQSLVYNKLHKLVNLTEGKTYCFSGWILTSGYGEGATRFTVNVAGTNYKYVMDLPNKQIANPVSGENEAFDNDMWYQFKIYYTADKTTSKEFSIVMDSKGTAYVDDLEVCEVEKFGEDYDVVGDNLLTAANGNIGGDFEFELMVAPNVNIEGETAVADAYIGNCFLMKPDSKIIIAVYDASGSLLSVNQKLWSECMPEDCEYTAYEGNMQVSAPYSEGNLVKTFVWDGMKPLCEVSNL